jgi:1-acyl-sn-glycerol-3-phosphate acyltransferase
LREHPLRVTVRLLWLGGELTLAAARFGWWCGFCVKEELPATRAEWLKRSARRVSRVFGVEARVRGAIPTNGLLVCNHLSYIDILVLAACAPSVFVAKREVKGWPVFGWFARIAGTIFVNREKRTAAGQMADEIERALHSGVLVVLFPEGTSSGGQTVLPFKSALLEPATRQAHTLSAGLIQYDLDDGDPAEEVCYWKDMTLVPHLINLLGKRRVRASVGFTQLRRGSADRKELARQLHAEVIRLQESVAA